MTTVLELKPIPEGIPGSSTTEDDEEFAPKPDAPLVVLTKKFIAEKQPIDVLTKLYLKLRAGESDLKRQAKEKLAPVNTSMELIENYFLNLMNELQVDSLKNESGTPYRTTKTTVSVEDNPAFLDFVLTRALAGLPIDDKAKVVVKNAMIESGQLAMIEARAAKVAVEAYLEETKELPAGLKRTAVSAINVRS